MSNRAERRASDPSVLARAAQHDVERKREARRIADRAERQRRREAGEKMLAAAREAATRINRAGK